MTKNEAMKALRKSAHWKKMSQQERAMTNAFAPGDLVKFVTELGVTQGQSRKSKGAKKGGKTTAAQRRSRLIAKAIKAGTVAVKQNKAKASDMQGKMSAKKKAAAFVKLYKGVKVASRKSRKGKVAKKSLKKAYGQMQGQKHPYFIEKGYVSKVGGGPSGPGVIRKIGGIAAKPFNQLGQAQQQAVISFLDSEKGKKLRGPGAKKKAARNIAIGHQILTKSRKQRASRKSKSRSSRRAASK
jgi:hypothetical protein